MKLNKQNSNYVMFFGVGSELYFKRFFLSEKSLYKAWRTLYMLNTKIYAIDRDTDTLYQVGFDENKELRFI